MSKALSYCYSSPNDLIEKNVNTVVTSLMCFARFQKIRDIDSNKEFKGILDFSIERYKFYSPQRGELISSSIEFLKILSSKDAKAALKYLQDMDKLFELL